MSSPGMSPRLIAFVCVALAWLAAATSVSAETKVVKTAKLSLDVPAAWKVEVKDASIKGESKDKEVALLVWIVDSADVAAAEKAIEGEIYSAVASLKWSKGSAGKVHGLAVSFVDGIGHAVGGDVDIKAAIVGPTKAKKTVVVVAAIAHAKLDAHKAEIKALFDSATPTK